ncbi:23S rRNA methyltransferase [Phytophthora palmivora]|uniref:23S rRNA methyltransferase n=1 Tax=Phytophthora palmivora TaxID=4796 RepID=A0A2P4YLN5_9STRA|nr:23S rRNA methyltransferase [Phytophthora palmivora]
MPPHKFGRFEDEEHRRNLGDYVRTCVPAAGEQHHRLPAFGCRGLGPLKKEITANWAAETMEAKQRVADGEDDMVPEEKCAKCDLVEGCWEECLCYADCLCYESCVRPVDKDEGAAVDLSALNGDETDTVTGLHEEYTQIGYSVVDGVDHTTATWANDLINYK